MIGSLQITYFKVAFLNVALFIYIQYNIVIWQLKQTLATFGHHGARVGFSFL